MFKQADIIEQLTNPESISRFYEPSDSSADIMRAAISNANRSGDTAALSSALDRYGSDSLKAYAANNSLIQRLAMAPATRALRSNPSRTAQLAQQLQANRDRAKLEDIKVRLKKR